MMNQDVNLQVICRPVYKVSTSTPQGCFFCYTKYMSTLHHESLIESIYESLVEEMRTDLFNFTQDEIDQMVQQRFEDLCQ